ncbi:MAG: DUF177 domain-containing protein [Rubricoccaceae bacterium]|nr:DUF177 domain-containing protein [Rubricoccaceae bacterium]
MLQIDLTSLDDGLHEFELHPEPEELELDPSVFRSIVTHIRADLSDGKVFATYDIEAVATLQCDRTARLFDQTVSGGHAIAFMPPDEIPHDSDDENVLPLPVGDTRIDLTRSARDTLVLALPVRRVAPDAEDKELKTVFGAPSTDDDAPIDDRWEALRGLQSDDT